MQNTLTIRGKRFTGKQIADKFSHQATTHGGDYIVYLNGDKYFANYRQVQDSYWAPVCNAKEANCVSLMPDNGFFRWTKWVRL